MNLFTTNPTTKKLKGKIDLSIYSTPGDNDHVFKNRDSRLHPIAFTSKQEKHIRESWSGGVKDKKLKCSIPLKEKSTLFMLSTAYLDYMAYTVNILDMDEHIDKGSTHYKMCNDMLSSHKDHLVNYFTHNKRKVFDEEGNTVCAVSQQKLRVSDIADPTRNNRVNPLPTDIQMGHIASRCDECFTVYGKNIVMMSRRGNLLIGEHSFIEDIWLDEINSILTYQKYHIDVKSSAENEKGLRILELETQLAKLKIT